MVGSEDGGVGRCVFLVTSHVSQRKTCAPSFLQPIYQIVVCTNLTLILCVYNAFFPILYILIYVGILCSSVCLLHVIQTYDFVVGAWCIH